MRVCSFICVVLGESVELLQPAFEGVVACLQPESTQKQKHSKTWRKPRRKRQTEESEDNDRDFKKGPADRSRGWLHEGKKRAGLLNPATGRVQGRLKGRRRAERGEKGVQGDWQEAGRILSEHAQLGGSVCCSRRRPVRLRIKNWCTRVRRSGKGNLLVYQTLKRTARLRRSQNGSTSPHVLRCKRLPAGPFLTVATRQLVLRDPQVCKVVCTFSKVPGGRATVYYVVEVVTCLRGRQSGSSTPHVVRRKRLYI